MFHAMEVANDAKERVCVSVIARIEA